MRRFFAVKKTKRPFIDQIFAFYDCGMVFRYINAAIDFDLVNEWLTNCMEFFVGRVGGVL